MLAALRLRSLLASPRLYAWFNRLVGGSFFPVYVEEYADVAVGHRILDLGCGVGDILEYLPAVNYVGVDLNERYIRAATTRFGSRGLFIHGSIRDPIPIAPGSFDRVMANGVLHHLNDGDACHLLTVAHEALTPLGKFIAVDGCLTTQQSRSARLLLRLDRGANVRTLESYRTLAESVFPMVRTHLREDLLRIPYTHIIMECEKNERR